MLCLGLVSSGAGAGVLKYKPKGFSMLGGCWRQTGEGHSEYICV